MTDVEISLARKVFLIHGHDKENLETLKRILQQQFKLVPVVLKEHPDAGLTVIEKFERLAEQCCFAVVLLTPDDHVQAAPSEKAVWQPRPNVVFELGWFCGRLGRGKILFLCKKGTQLPSDFNSVLQKQFVASVSEPEVIKQMELELHHQRII